MVVNFRVGPLCVQLLESLEGQLVGQPACNVVIVDNASGDGSDALIEAEIRARNWSSWASLMRAPFNGGCASGNNLAIRPALASSNPPEYVLLLNPDTIVRDGAIQTLWNFLEQNPPIGIAGSRLEDEDGTQQHSRFRFPNFWGEVDYMFSFSPLSRLLKHRALIPPLKPYTEQVDWLAGASMMIRREVFDQIGLLDEEYFMYFEETDFCLQARRSGWTCWYVAESHVVHLVGRSSDVDVANSATRDMPPYWFRSRRHYWVKNYGYLFALWVDLAAVCSDLLRRLRLFLTRKPDRKPKNFSTGVLGVGFSRGSYRPATESEACDEAPPQS